MKNFNFFDKLFEQSRTLRRVGMVLVMCLTVCGNAWGRTTLFTTNFSTSDGWSTEDIITSSTTTNSKTIKGTTISFGGYKSSNVRVSASESSGTLNFTNNNLSCSAGDITSSNPNYYMAIPVSGIVGGTVIVTYTYSSSCRPYYTYDDGNSGSVVARAQAPSGGSTSGSFTITGLSNTSATIYLGASGGTISSITIETLTLVDVSASAFYSTYASSSKTADQLISSASFPSYIMTSIAAVNSTNTCSSSVTSPHDFSTLATGTTYCRLKSANSTTIVLEALSNVKSIRLYGNGNGAARTVPITVTKVSGTGNAMTVSSMSMANTPKVVDAYTTGDLTRLTGYKSNTYYTYTISFPGACDIWGIYVEAASSSCTVTYDGNGKDGGGAAPTDASSPYASGSNVTVLGNTNSMTKTGYSFGGWNTAADGSGTSYAAEGTISSIAANTTLYAKWTQPITLNGNGGTGNSTSVTATYNCATLPSITNPTKSGYVFKGWFTGEGGTGNLVINKKGQLQANVTGYTGAEGIWTSSSARTLYAKWEQFALPATLDKSNVTDYSEMSWYGSSDEYFDFGPTAASNLDRWAEWEVYVAPCTYEISVEVAVPADPDGYQWGLQLVNDDEVVASYNSSQVWGTTSTTYAAKWNLSSIAEGEYVLRVKNIFEHAQPKLKNLTLDADTYTVTYNADGGSCATSSEEALPCGSVTLPTPTKSGYTFDGWYNSSDEKIGDAGASYEPTADITLYAKWTEELSSARTYDGEEKMYFLRDAWNWWAGDAAVFYAYFWNSSTSESAWSGKAVYTRRTTDNTKDIWEYTVPEGTWDKVIITRHPSGTTTPTFDNASNKSNDITLEATTNFLTDWTVSGETGHAITWKNITLASKKVYFDNRNYSTWTTAYVRIGHSTSNSVWGAMTKVGGTKYLYEQSTSAWDYHTYLSVANAEGWAGSNNVYQPWENQNWASGDIGYKITKQTTYQNFGVARDVYLCPTSTSMLERECQYYNVNGGTSTNTLDYVNAGTVLPAYEVTSSGTHCTVTMVKYTADDFSTSESLSSGGTVKPTQYIGVTVTPDAGYKFSSVSLSTGKFEQHTAAAAGVTGKYAIMADECEVTAVCVEDTYTITYKDGGDVAFSGVLGDGSPEEHTYGTPTPLVDPTRDGYEFGGWYTNANFTGSKVTTLTADGYTANITLYAQWTKNVYLEMGDGWDSDSPWFAVYYYKSGSSGVEGWAEMELADACSNPAVYTAQLPMAVYDYLIFVRMDPSKDALSWDNKWTQTENVTYPTTNFKYTITDIDGGEDGKSTGSWGTYSAPTYTISFAGNDNTGGSMSNISSIACDADQAITANAFTKTGYSFAGWKANVNVTIDDATVTAGTVIDDEKTIQNIRSNITLTAQWTAKSCTVEFNTNGGIGTITSVTATYDAAMPTKAGNLPTKAGYDFAGFWDGEGGSGTQYYNADGTSKINWDKNTTSNTTLYAKWTEHVYTITLDLEGGSGTTSVTATYNSTLSDDALFDAPTLSGYSFGGFYTSEAGGGSQLINENRKWNKSKDGYIDGSKKWIYDGEDNITLKAKWTQTVTLDDNGGSADGGATATYNSTSLSSISAPTYSGHTVDGYYTSANCTTKVATDAGALQASITVDEVAWTNSSSQWIKDGSAKFYAHWKCNTPTITDNGDNTVSITVPSGTTVRYTTDGTTPSSSTGTVYSDAFDIEEDVIVKAIAYQSGCTDSELASETCTYTAPGDGCWDPANTAADKLSSGDVSLTTFENNFSGVSGITSVTIESKSASDIGGCSGEDGDKRGYMKVKNVQNEGNKIITIVLSSAKDITIGGINYSSNSGDFYLVKSTDTSTELAKLTTDVDGETATAENCVAGTYYIYAKTATNNKSISFSKLCIEEPIAAYDITEGTHSNGTIAITDGSSAITEAEKDDVVYITATPSTGYSFTSWDVYKTGESTTKVTLTDDDDHGSFSMPDYGVTVDATFSLVDYTLTWDMNGGKVTTEGTGADVDDTGEQSTTLNYGDAITKPIVARDGYKFVGWDDGSGIVTPAATMPAGDVTYTAQWHQQFTITHNLSKTTTESGTVAYENEEYSATYAAVAGYALPTAVLVYHGLTNITASCTWEDGTLTIPGAQITGDITITVRSVRAECSVSYDGDTPSSGSAPTDSKNYRYGDVVTVKGDNGMTKMGYNFRGWLDDDNDIFYKEGQTFIITDNVTLTAVWESTSGGGGCYEWEGDPASYTDGSFTADDNLVIVADPTTPGKTAITATARISTNPSNLNKTCITIDGTENYITGYLSDGAEITSLSIGASTNQDNTDGLIVAVFCADEDFSSGVTVQTATAHCLSTAYSDATFIQEFTPASGTKYFRIYRKINQGTTIGDYTAPTGGVGSQTLRIFHISACSSGGSSDSNFDVTFADGTAVTPASHDEWPSSIVGVPDGKKITVEDPITVGYAFLGWYDDDACSVGHKVDLDNLTVTEDITLYAKWVTNEHTFVGGTEDHEAEWETDGNWESGTAPDTDYPYSYAQVNIKAPAVMATGTKERVGRVDIVNDGSSNTGKLTINSGAMLIVYDRVYRIENTSTNERLATQEDDIYLGSEFGDNYTRHRAGGVNGALVMGKYNGTGVNATVQFACLAWFNSSAYDEEHKWQATDINQYIGIPFNELTPNDYDNHDPEYDRTSSMLYSYETSNNRWYPMIGTDKMAPFVGYDILWIRGAQPKFDLQGTLVASENQTLDLRSYGGASFAEDNETLLANSWAAPINIAKFEVEDFNHAEATIYMFNAGTGVDYGDIGWTYGKTTLPGQYSSLPIEYVKAYYDEYEGFRTIPSMQSFSILTAEDGDASITLDYKRLVYDGAVAYKTIEPMHAPRRAPKASSKPLEIKIAVQGASGLSDVACILEREDFTYGFDNGWEASKLYGIWEVPTLYAVTETGIRAIVAVPNADGQELAFCAGTVDDVYTISFDYSSEAEPLYLYDKETDIYTQVLTGGTYTFTTNDKNDHNRFVLTRSYVPSVATGVDNVEQFNTDVQKVIINDHIYIIRGGRMYSVDGVVVK